MLDNVKKCKNFLSTLIKLAASQPEATVSSVRDLIQGLIVSQCLNACVNPLPHNIAFLRTKDI